MSLILPHLTSNWGPVGHHMVKCGDKPKAVYSLKGRLFLSKSGWILLSVPNSLIRGAFDALDEPGIELPFQDDGQLRAHISVIRSEELEKIPGGADAISERGHVFSYNLGKVKAVAPSGWPGISRVWLIEVRSPELEKLRKSYGLTPKPKNNQFEFHITLAVRHKKVLQNNPVSKAAASAYTYPEMMRPTGRPSLWRLLLGFSSSEPWPQAAPAEAFKSLTGVEEHFTGKGFRDIQQDDFGNFFMTDPAGNELIWSHEENALVPVERFYKDVAPGFREPKDVFPIVNPSGRYKKVFQDNPISKAAFWLKLAQGIPGVPMPAPATIAPYVGKAVGGVNKSIKGLRSAAPVLKTVPSLLTRRYLSNTAVPITYDSDVASAYGMPPTPRKIWEHAIKDQPVPMEVIYKHAPYMHDTLRVPLKIRRELLRRGLGLPPWAGRQYLQSIGETRFVPTENSGGIKGVFPGVQLTPEAVAEIQENKKLLAPQPNLYRDKQRYLSDPSFLSSLLGDYGRQVNREAGTTRITDLWDFALSPEEKQELRETMRWPVGRGKRLKSLLARNMLNAMLPRGGVVFDQDFHTPEKGPWEPIFRKTEGSTLNPLVKIAIDGLNDYTRTKVREDRRLSPFFWSLAKVAKKKRKQPAGYLKETEKIRKNRVGKGSKPHKFVAAEWTHPNGHPRCLLCGDEERIDGHCDGYKAAGLFTKQALRALGIPDKSQYGDLSKLEPGQLLDLIIQAHTTGRGLHHDVRIGDPSLGLLSWATRKELPEPGGKTMLFRQPLHSHGYGAFQGIIPKGKYGGGVVRTHTKGKVLVTKVEPDKISFTTAHERYPQRFVLLRPRSSMDYKEKQWLLINTTPREVIPYEKVHYTKIPAEEVEPHLRNLQQGASVQAKIDGAASLVKLLKDGVEIVSYRQSKTTGRPILHTEKVLGGRPKLRIPPELVGTILKGELYGVRKEREDGRMQGRDVRDQSLGHQEGDEGRIDREGAGNGRPDVPEVRSPGDGRHLGERAIPPQELGGLLNAAIARSLAEQRGRAIRLKLMAYDVQQLGKTKIDPSEVPYAKRREWLAKVLQHLPAGTFHLPTEAEDPESARQLWERIRGGQEPTTQEGIVIHPATGKPMKSKLLEEQDVHLTGVFPGEGKYKGTGAGGFTYALEPGGSTIGRVGTGLSDELRRELFKHPEEFAGRVARVRSQGAFPKTRALRAPALIALHEG